MKGCHEDATSLQSSQTSKQPVHTGTAKPGSEAMKLDNTRLTPAKRCRWLALHLCLYCCPWGHVIMKPPTKSTVIGKPLGPRKVNYSEGPIQLQVGCFHKKNINFLVLERSAVSVILGCPWLMQHNLFISLSNGVKWGSWYFSDYFSGLLKPVHPNHPTTISRNSILSCYPTIRTSSA